MILIDQLIKQALAEDIGDGDHTTFATINKSDIQKAKLIVKENGIIAGIEIAKRVFNIYDPLLKIETFRQDGDSVQINDVVFIVEGKAQSILTTERLVLNIMQRMSGIATKTAAINNLIKDTSCKILDTRKTTPNFRWFEKEAVKIGGGINHRFGLFDMILIKDNHIDYAGGIVNALNKTFDYLKNTNKTLDIEIEVRNLTELEDVLAIGKIKRILFDNFSPELLSKAVAIVKLYNHQKQLNIQTEASGGITEQNIRKYALTGVDFISMGALTHSVKSLDLSLKAINE
jgi:nicotinate-nucleotide pyrophosphorylase (carboxylating)